MEGEQTRGELLRSRALIILGLSGLAVAQPLLDLFGNNPEFFVAGNYSRAQIVGFALLIALVPPLVGIGVTAAGHVRRSAGRHVVFGVVVGGLARRLRARRAAHPGVDATLLVFVAAIAAGVGVAVLVVRARGAQLFVSYLAAANLLFVGSFLFLSPTAELVAGGSAEDLGSVDVPALRGPVVVVVLDEFPAATIMRADGSLNAERYPGIRRARRREHVVPQRFEPVQPHSSRRADDPHRHVGDEDDLPTLSGPSPQPVHPAR